MIRIVVLAAALLSLPGTLPRRSASPPPRFPATTLAEAADSARLAWLRRDFRAFLAPAGDGRLLVTLPKGGQSAPITGEQARTVLAAYVQGTQEVTVTLKGAREVDSLAGYVELTRRYRVVGLPGEREELLLLGYRRGRSVWVLTELRIGS